MRRAMWIVWFMLCYTASTFSVDFEVTSVRKIGDGTWSISPGLVKFSPSGEFLSYPRGQFMVVSDIGGNLVSEIPFQGRMTQYEWLNDSGIVIIEREDLPPPKSLWRMSAFTISTSSRTTILEYVKHDSSVIHKYNAFKGLTRTRSGKIFTHSVNAGKKLEISSGGTVGDPHPNSGQQRKLEEKEFFWGDGGLYRVTVGLSDSAWVFPKPNASRSFWSKPVWNSEMTYVMHDQYLMRLLDTSIILIDTILGTPPEGSVICDVDVPMFNPRFQEVAFNLVCYGKSTPESHELDAERDHVALLDLESWTIVVLDSLINLEECRSPSFSPNGVDMTLMSKGRVYVIRREIK